MTESSGLPETPAESGPGDRSPGSRLFLFLLGTVSVFYAVVLIYHASVPPGGPDQTGFLEQCRRICQQYGLVSTGHIRHDARAFLTAVNKQPLSDGLQALVSDPQFVPEATQPHPLLGRPAPDFELLNEDGNPRKLSTLPGSGPVLLVFYYGFSCSHCVAQLYALNDDVRYFNELGVRIVAISSDKPQQTAAAFAEYGKFPFTMLSDPDDATSRRYSCSLPPSRDSDGFRKHGTFLLDSQGTIVWANTGFLPFVDNRSLLTHAANLQQLPAAAIAAN